MTILFYIEVCLICHPIKMCLLMSNYYKKKFASGAHWSLLHRGCRRGGLQHSPEMTVEVGQQ